MSQFSVRRADERDLDRLIAIHQNAFPDARDANARRRNFAQNKRFSLHDLFVIESADHIVGHAFFGATHGWFGRKKVKVGTIASVGVAPEARGHGVGSALLSHLHAHSNELGCALDILYPVSHAFYHRFGYETVSPYVHLEAHPLAFPPGERRMFHPVTGADAADVAALHERFSSERTGMLVRTEEHWQRRFIDETQTHLCLRTGNQVTSYVTFTLSQRELHGPARLLIRDWAWSDARAQRALWSWVRSMAGQAWVVEVDVARDDALLDAIRDAAHGRFGTEAIEHPIGTLAAGPSIRIMHVARALSARGYHSGESLSIAVGGERFTLAQGQVTPLAQNEPCEVTLSLQGMTQLAFGGVNARSLVAMGRLEGISPEAIAKTERVFSMPHYFSPDGF